MKRNVAGIWKLGHCVKLSSELAFEETMKLLRNSLRDDYGDGDELSTGRRSTLYRRCEAYSADSKQTDTDKWQLELQVNRQQHIYFTGTVLLFKST